jgi:MoaA/NifB/PqqE/SkfB family radical SAM enzyme
MPVDPDLLVEMVRRIRCRARQTKNGMFVTFHPELDDSQIRRWYGDPHDWVQRRPAVCAWMNADILSNGAVEPCLGLSCGNITERSFAEIWNGPIYREFRRRLADVETLPICVRCCFFFRRD